MTFQFHLLIYDFFNDSQFWKFIFIWFIPPQLCATNAAVVTTLSLESSTFNALSGTQKVALTDMTVVFSWSLF